MSCVSMRIVPMRCPLKNSSLPWGVCPTDVVDESFWEGIASFMFACHVPALSGTTVLN